MDNIINKIMDKDPLNDLLRYMLLEVNITEENPILIIKEMEEKNIEIEIVRNDIIRLKQDSHIKIEFRRKEIVEENNYKIKYERVL